MPRPQSLRLGTLAILLAGLASPALAGSVGSYFVVDNTANTVYQYAVDNATGAFASSPVQSYSVPDPMGVALSGNNLFVSSLSTGTVQEFNASTGGSEGTFASGMSGGSNGIVLPFQMAVSPDGTTLAVSNYNGINPSTGAATGEVLLYNLATGNLASTFSSPGLVGPTGLAFAGGNLYVSSSLNNQVYQFNATPVLNPLTGLFGPATSQASGTPMGLTSLSAPAGLAVDGKGDLYVANFRGGGGVSVFNVDGTTSTIGAGLIGQASDVVFGPNGELLVSSYADGKVYAFGADGTPLGPVIGGLQGPTYTAFNGSFQTVPEPASVALLGLGLGVVGLARLRRRPAAH